MPAYPLVYAIACGALQFAVDNLYVRRENYYMLLMRRRARING